MLHLDYSRGLPPRQDKVLVLGCLSYPVYRDRSESLLRPFKPGCPKPASKPQNPQARRVSIEVAPQIALVLYARHS